LGYPALSRQALYPIPRLLGFLPIDCNQCEIIEEIYQENIRAGDRDALHLLPPCGLAVRFLASSLSRSHSGIRTEPAAANAAGFLSCVAHGDSSSPRLSIKEGLRSTFCHLQWTIS